MSGTRLVAHYPIEAPDSTEVSLFVVYRWGNSGTKTDNHLIPKLIHSDWVRSLEDSCTNIMFLTVILYHFPNLKYALSMKRKDNRSNICSCKSHL